LQLRALFLLDQSNPRHCMGCTWRVVCCTPSFFRLTSSV
jgi:hypothetical protein